MRIFSKLRRKSKPRLTYGSKDYIEHLRTVHFALLSVSAGLLLLILSVKPYDSQKAVVQLENIIRLKGLWTPKKLLAYADTKEVEANDYKGSLPIPKGSPPKPLPIAYSDSQGEPPLAQAARSTSLDTHKSPREGRKSYKIPKGSLPIVPPEFRPTVVVDINEPFAVILNDASVSGNHLSLRKANGPRQRRYPLTLPSEKPQFQEDFFWLEHPLGSFPDDLRNFAAWWNALGETTHKYLSTWKISVSESCTIQIGGGSGDLNMSLFPGREHPEANTKCEVEGWNEFAGSQDKIPHTRLDPLLGSNLDNKTTPVLVGELVNVKPSTFVYFDISNYEENAISQSNITKVLPGIRNGDFATSFPDLSQATEGPLQSLELSEVLKHLSAASSSSEVFEAFGLRIPAEQVTGWGALVTVCIQLYLYLYLRGLKKPLEASDEAWKVGWFAANDALLPRLIFLMTVFALPVIAVTILSMHALDQRMQQKALTWSWNFVTSRNLLGLMRDFKAVPLLICGCCLSLVLGYLTWANRPSITRGSEQSRPQLFE